MPIRMCNMHHFVNVTLYFMAFTWDAIYTALGIENRLLQIMTHTMGVGPIYSLGYPSSNQFLYHLHLSVMRK